MVFEGKKNADKWYPVRLVNPIDLVTPVTGKANTDLTVTYGVEAATSGTSYSPAVADWKEQGIGDYWLRIGASEFTTENTYLVQIAASATFAAVTIRVEVRDMLVSEFMDGVDLVNAPNATAVAAIQNGLATTANQTTIINAIADVPTVAEFNARTLIAASYATAAAQTEMKGAGFDTATDSLVQIRDNLGGSAPTAAQIRAEMDSNSTQLAAIKALQQAGNR